MVAQMTLSKAKFNTMNNVHNNETGLNAGAEIVDNLPMGKGNQKKGRRPKAPAVFSKNLRKLLDENDMTLREAANIAGTSPSVIAGWTTGATPNDPEALLRLTEKLGADYQYIMTGKPSVGVSSDRLSEIFEIEDSAEFSGVFLLEAKRLKWRK